MDARPKSEPLPLASRLLSRILDQSRRLDYLALAAFAAFPLLHAWLIGAHATRGSYAGYWTRANWTLQPLALPLFLLSVRWVASRVVPVSSSAPPASPSPTVALVASEEGRRQAYVALRQAILSPRNLIAAVAVTALFMLADTGGQIAFYLGLDWDLFPELDWSTMFLLPDSGISRASNLLLNVSAYSVQALGMLIGIVFEVVLLRHNLWFLRRIHQRRWVPEGEQSSFIQIDLDDVDHCFGFRRAHAAFNPQVIWLVVSGLLMLVFRFANVGGQGSARVAVSDPLQMVLAVLPDAGQWIIALIWLAGFLVVVLPGLVKFLPHVPIGDNAAAHRSIVGYLQEFLPDEAWPGDPRAPSEAVIDDLAGRFAANAFWPTGDNRAELLFLFATWVFLLILVPDARLIAGDLGPGWLILTAGLAISAALAWLATRLAFRALENALRFVDPRLVGLRPGTVAPAAEASATNLRSPGRIHVSLFLNYRRSDTRAYAGRLHDALSSHVVAPARVFRDVEAIEAGIDFVDAIEEALDASGAVIVLIGPQWLTATDPAGRPRIQDPKDFVHREIAGAIARNTRIFPVLVDAASMPAEGDLPEALAPLARRNALEITDSRWEYDVGRLLEALGRVHQH